MLIVGLGNPEEDYAKTRHNMGFDVINKLAKEYEIEITRTKFKGLYGMGTIEDEKVILLKPQTYMNLSGESIEQFKKFYKLENSNIIVVSDDITIEPGSIRVRRKGSSGAHNGLKSVIDSLKTEEFTRIRVGVGRPNEKTDIIDHVIGHVEDSQYAELEPGIEKAKEAVVITMKKGIDAAMNKFNLRKESNAGNNN